MKTRKYISTWITAALFAVGATLWSGCSNNEQLDSVVTDNTDTAAQAGSFSFKLKGAGVKTRATQDATEAETKVNTMYVAFFIKNENETEVDYKLHRIFHADASNSSWSEDTKITVTDELDGTKSFNIPAEKMQTTFTYTGTYIVYFIANPEAAIITQMKGYEDTDIAARTTLGTFEKDLLAKEVAYDAASTETRGFTMTNKSTLEVAESPQNYEVKLTRLAARFDFINSSPTDATITNVKFNNLPKQSDVMQKSEMTPGTYFYAGTATELTKTWPTSPSVPASMTVYTYENLNTNTNGNVLYSSIEVTYKLTAEQSQGEKIRTLRIDLKEQDAPLAIMRNHLYKINLNCLAGTYDITVEDWVGGETVTIPNDKLAITYTANNLGKVGDYVYNNNGTLAFSDGGLRKMYLDGSLEWDTNHASIKAITDGSKGKCVGIVFSNNPSAKDKADGFTHGYVMALNITAKNAWCTTAYNTSLPNLTTKGAAVSDLDGRKNWETLKSEKNSSGSSYVFPVLKAAADYAVTLPSNTSGWYAPSIGQLCCMLDNLCKFNFKSYSQSTAIFGSNGGSLAMNNGTLEIINAKLAGSSSSSKDYHLFQDATNYNQASTSEYSTNTFLYLNTSKSTAIIATWATKTGDPMFVRPVFAY